MQRASYDVLYYIIYLTFAKINHLHDIFKFSNWPYFRNNLYIKQCILSLQ